MRYGMKEDENAGSSVAVPESSFGLVMVAAYENIKQNDSRAAVALGGLVGGADRAAQYVRTVVNSQAVRAFRERAGAGKFPFDAIGVHPYLKYAGNRLPPWVDPNNAAGWGFIGDTLAVYARLLPQVPLWVTECGIAQYTPEWWAEIANFMRSFVKHFQDRRDNRFPVLLWFGYSDGGGKRLGLPMKVEIQNSLYSIDSPNRKGK